jgi:hypothetical protein
MTDTDSNEFSSQRRTLFKTGLGLATMAVAGYPALAPRSAAAATTSAGSAASGASTASGSSSAIAGSDTAWHRYLVGPTGQQRRSGQGDRVHRDVKDPNAVLKPGGGVAVLTRPQPPVPPSWPTGTTATASSFHAPNDGDDGTYTTYDPSNAIDGDPTTFWNDANPNTYPAC